MKFKVGDLVIPKPSHDYYFVARHIRKYIGKIKRLDADDEGYIEVVCISHEEPNRIGVVDVLDGSDFMTINEAVKQGCFYEQEPQEVEVVLPAPTMQEMVDRAIRNLEENWVTEPITVHHMSTFNPMRINGAIYVSDGTDTIYYE